MDAIAATPVVRPQPTRIAPVFDEERTAPATVVASAGEGEAQQSPKFSDVVAILNPLQHLPVVGTIYRKLTDDVPHPAARAIGGALWGGPFGLLGAILSYVAEQVSGKSTTEIVRSIFDGTGASAPSVAEQGTGAPRQLVPSDASGEPARAEAMTGALPSPVLAQASPASTAPAAQAATQPQTSPVPTQAPTPSPTAGELRPRNAATRDLAFYQAHAGARLPPSSSSSAPVAGPQAPTQMPSFQRAVTPMLGSEPIGGAAPAPAPAASTPLASGSPPVSPQDFMQRMRRGLDQYQSLNRSAEAPARAQRLDRVE